MSTMPEAVEGILAKLAKDVEQAVHAMYRRQAGPDTTMVRTEHMVRDAADRVASFLKSTPAAPAPGAPPQRFTASVVASSIAAEGTEGGWTGDEAQAITKCIMAWLPMGSPTSAKPDSRCMAPGKELIPTWGEREIARQAVRKVAVKGA